MNVIIPMAGEGQRFIDAGYKEPKPLIGVGGKRIVEYVIDMYDKENDNFIFICNDKHLESTDMGKVLTESVAKSTVLSMPSHKLGPVYTVLWAERYIEDEMPCIVSYCDNPVEWSYAGFKNCARSSDMDGCIVSHTGFHPHTLSSTLFAYSKTDNYNRVSEIKEKSCYTNDRFTEHASSGVYYFKYGYYIKKYFKQLINDGLHYRGEYYVTLVYNLLIKDGLRVFSYLNGTVLAFGTPREIQNFEAWMTIIDGGQVRNEEELIKCYEYWKGYKK